MLFRLFGAESQTADDVDTFIQAQDLAEAHWRARQMHVYIERIVAYPPSCGDRGRLVRLLNAFVIVLFHVLGVSFLGMVCAFVGFIPMVVVYLFPLLWVVWMINEVAWSLLR